LVANVESGNVRANVFDDPGQLGTEDERQRLELNRPLTNEGVPVADARRLHPNQQLSSTGFRTRHVIR